MLYTILAGLFLLGDGAYSLGKRMNETKNLEDNLFTVGVRLSRILVGFSVALAGEVYLPALEPLGLWLCFESEGSILWYREELSNFVGNIDEEVSIRRRLLPEMALRVIRLCLGLSFTVIV